MVQAQIGHCFEHYIEEYPEAVSRIRSSSNGEPTKLCFTYYFPLPQTGIGKTGFELDKVRLVEGMVSWDNYV